MKRRDFINFAALFAAARHLPFPATEDELFRFDFSSIHALLKKVPQAERETATLMMKNLLFDMEYIFKQTKNKTDLATLKKLAEEADQKFYTENKLKATSFRYQPLTLAKLEAMKKNTVLKPGEFDTMLKSIKYYANKIKTSGEKFEKLIPQLLVEADMAAQKLKEAEEKVGCTKVLSVLTAVVIVVVAVVLAAFTFGAAGALVALAVIAAAAIIGGAIGSSKGNNLLAGAFIGASGGISAEFNTKNILDEKVKIAWVNFDKRIKCAFLSVVNTIAMSIFGNRPYPTHSIMGSVAVNIVAITGQIPGIEADC